LARYGNPAEVRVAAAKLASDRKSNPETTNFIDRLTNTNPTYKKADSFIGKEQPDLKRKQIQ